MQRVTENQQNLPASLSVVHNPAQVPDSKYLTDKVSAINILAGESGYRPSQVTDSKDVTGSI